MIELRENSETRSRYLARVVIEFIEENNLEEYTADYDGTTCDGACLIVDLQAEFNIED